MSFLCYVHRRRGGVPHFEVLADMTQAEAIAHAKALLADRADGDRAELWADDELVFTVRHPGEGPDDGPA